MQHYACMATTDPGEGLTRLDALITPDSWSQVDGVNRASVVGWETMLSVVHLVHGIRTLHTAGRCHAAVPLLRLLMEYTLGTIWLANAGDEAVDVFNRKLHDSHSKLLADLGDMDLEARFPAEAVQTLKDTLAAKLPAHPDERLGAFRHLLTEFGFVVSAVRELRTALNGRTPHDDPVHAGSPEPPSTGNCGH